MDNSIKTDEIYEVKFEQLVEGEKQQLSALNDIMEGLMDVSVSMGSTKEKIGTIVNYKEGDIIILDKPVEEALEIHHDAHLQAFGMERVHELPPTWEAADAAIMQSGVDLAVLGDATLDFLGREPVQELDREWLPHLAHEDLIGDDAPQPATRHHLECLQDELVGVHQRAVQIEEHAADTIRCSGH